MAILLSSNLKNRYALNPTTHKKFPALQLIRWYLTSDSKDVYNNHFEGFRLLHRWLSPIDWTDVLPINIPEGLGSYEMQQMAFICNISVEKMYGAMLEIHYGKYLTAAIADSNRY